MEVYIENSIVDILDNYKTNKKLEKQFGTKPKYKTTPKRRRGDNETQKKKKI